MSRRLTCFLAIAFTLSACNSGPTPTQPESTDVHATQPESQPQLMPVAHEVAMDRDRVRAHLDTLVPEYNQLKARYDAGDTSDALIQRLARVAYFIGVNESPEHTAVSNMLFDEILQRDPDDVSARAYLGSNQVLEASRVDNAFAALGNVNAGAAQLDAAVRDAPDQLEARFIRGRTMLELPAIFNRRGQAKRDFATVAEGAASAIDRGELDPQMAAAALFHHGVFRWDANAQDEAIAAWRFAEHLAPGTLYGRCATLLLQGRR